MKYTLEIDADLPEGFKKHLENLAGKDEAAVLMFPTALKVRKFYNTPSEATQSPHSAFPVVGDTLTLTQINGLPAGSALKDEEGDKWSVSIEGVWCEADTTSNEAEPMDKGLFDIYAPWTLVSLPVPTHAPQVTEAPKKPEGLSLAQMMDMPNGTEFLDGSNDTWRKTNHDILFSWNGKLTPLALIHETVPEYGPFTLKKKPEIHTKTGPGPSLEEIRDMPTGTILKGKKYTWRVINGKVRRIFPESQTPMGPATWAAEAPLHVASWAGGSVEFTADGVPMITLELLTGKKISPWTTQTKVSTTQSAPETIEEAVCLPTGTILKSVLGTEYVVISTGDLFNLKEWKENQQTAYPQLLKSLPKTGFNNLKPWKILQPPF